MRVAIIASARHPIREPFAGGLEMHTHALATGLRERGHEVTVFASGDSDPEMGVEPVCPTASGLDLSHAARTDLSMLSRRFMEEHHAYQHLLLRLPGRDFDVIQNSSLHYLPVAMAGSLDTPFVTTLHTPPVPWIESAVAAAPEPSTITFVSVSEHNASSWSQVTVREVIPNGIDPRGWPFSASGDPGLAIWTGRIVPEKGPHLAVEAAHAAGLRIWLAGPADEGYLEGEVLPRLHPRDAYLGHLTQADLAEAVGGAGVQLVTPCWDEPFGLVVPEALSCGTPVAAFDRGAMSELLDEECGRLAPPDDIEALATAAVEALELDRRACRRHVEAHFTLDRMVDRYETLYLASAR
ncbi:MAG: glycosyltransferase family 4 protein [Actinobacteria bacterium]|nr:glycosyltransferase family 4 protein [Actinomycetota bacterium]